MFDKRLMKMCPESKKYIVGNIVFQWLELMMNAVMIYIIATAVGIIYETVSTAVKTGSGNITFKDLVTGGGAINISNILVALCVLVLTIIIRFFTTKMTARMSYMASKTVKRVMREQIYSKILRLGASYKEHASTAELVQESVEGTEQLESYFGQYVPQFFYAFLAPVSLFVLFGMAGSFKVAAVLLVCVPLIPGAIMMVQKIAKKLLSKYWDQYTKLGSTFLENLQGMTTLKTYKADAFKNEQMNEESEHFRVVTMKVLTMQLNSIIIMDFFAYGGAALGIALAVKAFMNEQIGLESTIFMILLSAEFFLPMRKLGSYFHVAMNGMAASDKIFKFLSEQESDEKPEIIPELPKASGEKEQIKSFYGCDSVISLENITFSYDGEKEVLKEVSLDIKEGNFVGIVGESGSGKSTIASLIMGRNTTNSGVLKICGIDINRINEESLFKNITYVGIGSIFFKGTVRENLAIALPAEYRKEINNEEYPSKDTKKYEEIIWNALEKCNISDYFKEQNGLDTMLTENAGNLSGGQKQRLALARALIHDSGIYIFDEATSNIDVESEEAILDRIKVLAKTRTVIMITHRLANVKDADVIYCMDSGRMVGSGTHEMLSESCDTYKRLWEVQDELENFGHSENEKKGGENK
ncbi:MAG: ABC transporter ATP-binding protein/permease [Lachnospiraceae bacterium]|nr:ABC transporter ATP-binding protein/permease [Lachnospiraceae bacterium]